jgi:hypothetical protein
MEIQARGVLKKLKSTKKGVAVFLNGERSKRERHGLAGD